MIMQAAESVPRQPRRPSWLNVGTLTLLVLVVLAWGPWILQHNAPEPQISIEDFGLHGSFTFTARLNTASLKDYKDKNYLMLIVRFAYTNIDRMSDTSIEKSTPYTIDGADVRMAIVGKINPPNLRIEPNAPVTIEYDTVLMPRSFSPDQIHFLNDVEHLGGRILSTTSQIVPFDSLGIAVAPPAVPATK
jgi:hypothetical protein